MRAASLQHDGEVCPVDDVEDEEDRRQDNEGDHVDLAQGVLSELVAQVVARQHRPHGGPLRHDLVDLAHHGSVETLHVTQIESQDSFGKTK